MCTITATELKNNLGKYLDMMTREEIAITKNGKYIGSLVPPKNEKLDSFFNDLSGILNEKDFENSDDPKIAHILDK
ncbi:MAG: type II toxin-antitoxin system Phd/YefM family antitoxin [Bacilli bacterium]|nr:type II toxin-antitoxin system Phd/YefM family antitoxin [Bacilli bacterium]